VNEIATKKAKHTRTPEDTTVRAECDTDMTTTDAGEDISSTATAGSKRQKNQIHHPDFVNYSDGMHFTISAEIIQIFQRVVNCRTQKTLEADLQFIQPLVLSFILQ